MPYDDYQNLSIVEIENVSVHSRLDSTIALHLLPRIYFRLGFLPSFWQYRLQSWVGCLDHYDYSRSLGEAVKLMTGRYPITEVKWISAVSGRSTNGEKEPPDAVR